jgi:ERF superfamily
MIETSEQTNSVWSKVFKVQEKNLSVVKSTPNAAFKQNGRVSKYADINSILEALIPELNEVKLVVACMPTTEGMVMQVTDVESGEWIRFKSWLNLTGQTAQQIGSQITYMRRYMYNSMFNLQAEDDDGNLTSGVSTTYEVPKASPGTTPATKPVLVGGSAHAEQLKKEYAAGTLKTWSQITDRYTVSDQVKAAIQATMPNLK